MADKPEEEEAPQEPANEPVKDMREEEIKEQVQKE